MTWQNIPIEELELSVRSNNCLLISSPYRTVGEIAEATDDDLLRIPNLGRRSLREIREMIAYVRPPDEPRDPKSEIIRWALDHEPLIRALMQHIR